MLRRWTGTDGVPVHADIPVDVLRSQRDRRAAASTVAAVLARGIGLAGSLIAVPLTIGYLGTERYGVFVTLTSLTSMLVFADLGLGNGLLNLLSDAHGRADDATARRGISSAAGMLIVVAVLFAIIFGAAYGRIDWAAWLNVSGARAMAEVGPAAAVFVGLFIIALPMGIVERIRMAYQEGFLNSIAMTIGGLLGLAGLLIAIWSRASLPVLVAAVSLGPLIALGGNGYRLFRSDRPSLRPRLALADRAMVLRLAKVGFLFLVLQIAVAVAYQSDVVVAAAVLGPEAAATYAVTLKVFLLVPTLVAIYLATLWPAYTEAFARGDAAWVRGTLWRSILIAFGTSLASSVILVLAGPWLIETWTGGKIQPPEALLIGAAVWAVLSATFNAIAILLNALSVVLFQVVVATVMAVGSIFLSVSFAGIIGLPGVILGTVVAYAVCSALPVLLYLPRLTARIESAGSVGSGGRGGQGA
jgi:O-antigen/teichoic acid export membrane protein